MAEEFTYTGIKKWKPTNDEWVDFYTSQKLPFQLLENEYLVVESEDESPQYYCYEHGKLRQFRGGSIKTVKEQTPAEIFIADLESRSNIAKNAKKTKEKKSSKGNQTIIYPRNEEQVCAFDMIKDSTKPIKLITGRWGSGKTMILVTAALEALQLGKFDKIVWLRNNIDVKDTKDLGALPGEVIDKLLPFLGPFIDHAGENSVRTMIQKGTLCVEPLQTIRGRNFKNTLIMCSEAENLTKEHIQLIIARAAEGSEVWLDGDNRQRDKVTFEKSRGLETLIERLQGEELFGYVHLVKSERSKVAEMADLLD